MEKITKNEAKEKIEEFFKELTEKSPKEIRKAKKMAMHYNIKLGEKRKRFCRKCYSPNLKVKSIKEGIKAIECADCRTVSRWKIK